MNNPAWPGWLRAWAVLATLICIWMAAMLLTPAGCNLLSRCPFYSALGIALLGAPVILTAMLSALVLSAIAWRRRR